MPSFLPKSMLVPLIVACALFMETLDGTIITTALPDMAVSFHDRPVHLSLGITAYMLSLAVFIPVSGWVADRFGAKRVFSAAIAVFTLGSLLCGLSNNVLELAGARILQGIGGAMMVPVGRLVLLRAVDKSELVRAMGYMTVPALIGPVLGPPVGGFITTYASWRWIFFLNLPMGLLGIYLVLRYIPNYREPETWKLDWLGFLTSGLSLTCLMYGFEMIGRNTVAPGLVYGCLGAGLAVGVLAILHARRHPHPLIDLSLLKFPTFAVTVTGGSLFRIGVGAIPFLLPLMLQVGFGMTAFDSGLVTFSGAVGSLAMKMTARPILKRYGFRNSMVVNGAISAVSVLVCCFFTRETPITIVFGLILAGGFFRSLQFTSLNTLAFAEVPPRQMSAATSLSSMMQQISLGMGVAVAALILHLSAVWRGSEGGRVDVTDFHVAFLIIGLLSIVAIWPFLRLTPEAGQDVSGHRARKPAPRDAAKTLPHAQRAPAE